MPKPKPFILKPEMRAEEISSLCPNCRHYIATDAIELHRTQCRPFEYTLHQIFAKIPPISCPQGCGMIHPFNLSDHLTIGCKAATAAHNPLLIDGADYKIIK